MQNFVDNYCYLDKIIMWFKIVVSCLPAAVIGLAFNDWIEAHLMNYVIVALMLIIYGVLFIIIENYNKTRTLSGECARRCKCVSGDEYNSCRIAVRAQLLGGCAEKLYQLYFTAGT